MKPKIFCFVNGSYSTGDIKTTAVSEDGIVLAGHLSSNIAWGKHDIGISSDRKHDQYKKYYPDGYELVWVEDIKTHEGVSKAFKINQAYSKEEYEKKSKGLEKNQPSIQITLKERE